jgi:GNAT superfamily N-acetyltransferase
MISIRPATVNDVPLLRTMIWELADFEREADSVEITEAQLARDGFGDDPKFQALIAEWDGHPAGYAVYFDYYSTWRGRQLFLEDLFVRPEFRGKKLGMTLLKEVARIAQSRDCRGMRWEVLAWNKPAIELYQSLGAELLDDWKLVMLDDKGQELLGKRAA